MDVSIEWNHSNEGGNAHGDGSFGDGGQGGNNGFGGNGGYGNDGGNGGGYGNGNGGGNGNGNGGANGGNGGGNGNGNGGGNDNGGGGQGGQQDENYWKEKYYDLLEETKDENLHEKGDDIDDFNAIFGLEVEKADLEAFLKDKALDELLAEQQERAQKELEKKADDVTDVYIVHEQSPPPIVHHARTVVERPLITYRPTTATVV